MAPDTVVRLTDELRASRLLEPPQFGRGVR
jgi:hypothetical protein